EVTALLRCTPGGARSDPPPVQQSGRFRVKAAAPAAAYTGVFTVIFGDTSDTEANLAASGRLQLDPNPDADTTPPTISVTLTPSVIWPPNNKMVEITASVQVSDDRDPNPVVRLVSITANEGDPSDIAGANY